MVVLVGVVASPDALVSVKSWISTMKTLPILIGLFLIVVTHLYILVASLPQTSKDAHAYIMLITAALIAYGVFT